MARCFGLETNLAKENEPEENLHVFPSRREQAITYRHCCAFVFYFLINSNML